MLNLNDLKIGDSVRFTNGQIAKVVDIKEKDETSLRLLYFDKKVACDVVSNSTYSTDWYYELNGECNGCTNHIVEIIMTVDLKTLEIGDTVRFKNGQVAKVVDIKVESKDKPRLYFNKEVACDTKENSPIYTRCWNYRYDGEILGCTNHIVEIMKKGEKTMNKHKIEKSLEWHKRKIAELEEALKESEIKRWFPKKDEQYYSIYNCEVESCHNISNETAKKQYDVNNIFKTREEAEKELSRRKAETELLDMCDWTADSDRMWMIFYDRGFSHFNTDYYFSQQHTPYCFASEESARKAIDKLGEEKLKLIFRI